MKQHLTRDEMRSISGGSGGDCASPTFSCTCNGVDYGCVSTLQECWDKC